MTRVLVAGERVPWEILLALGAEVELVPPDSPKPSGVTRRWVEEGMSPYGSRVIDRALSTPGSFDHVLVTGTGDELFRIYAYLAELYRRGIGVPEAFVLDIPTGEDPVAYGESRIGQYLEWLAKRGHGLNVLDLQRGASALDRRQRDAIAWYRRRHQGRVHSLAGLTSAIATTEDAADLIPAVLVGGWLDPSKLAEAIEQVGFRIVDEIVPRTPRRMLGLLAANDGSATAAATDMTEVIRAISARLRSYPVSAETTPLADIRAEAADIICAASPRLVIVIDVVGDETGAWDNGAIVSEPSISELPVVRMKVGGHSTTEAERADLHRLLVECHDLHTCRGNDE